MEGMRDMMHSADMLGLMDMLGIVDIIGGWLDKVIRFKLRFAHMNTESRKVCFFISLRLSILVKDFQRFVQNHFANSRIILQNKKDMFTTHILQYFCLP